MIHQFGPFRFDSSQRLLFREGERVPLVPKVAETLHVLLERRGELVDKAELMRQVWPETNVEEAGLARNISILRKALGDEDSGTPWIETIPRRGYRFAPATSQPAPPKRLNRAWIAAPALFLLAILIYHQFYVPSAYLHPGDGAALAVVPFECRCPDAVGETFAGASHDLLVDGLTRLPGVQVVAPGTVNRHRRAGVSMGLMGRLLGLDVLVEGTIHQMQDSFRTTIRLVDVHTGKIIWSNTAGSPGPEPRPAVIEHWVKEIGVHLSR